MTSSQTERNRKWLEKRPDYFEKWHEAHPEYRCWRAMRQRCANPKAPNYYLYGGRGITVYEGWQDYATFLADVGPRPGREYSLDRIDNNGNYEPGNVRWATRSEQQRNKRSKVTEEMLGIMRSGGSYADIARRLNEAGVLSPLGRVWSRQNVAAAMKAKDCFVRAALPPPAS
jgi:hypothetical protein